MSDNYEDFNLRQKGLIDAIALNRLDDKDLSVDEVLELAAELSGEKKYTPSSYYSYIEDHEDIIEDRKQILANQRESDDNDVLTVGDPMRRYMGPENGIDATMQHISERPSRVEDREWEVDLTRKQIFKLVRSADEKTAWEVFTQVFE